MRRPFHVGLFLAILALVVPLNHSSGQTKAKKFREIRPDSAARIQTNALFKLLQETIDLKDFPQPMGLKEALGLFHEKFAALGKDLPILIDEAAFQEVQIEFDDTVRFPPFPKKMTLAMALNHALSQLGQESSSKPVVTFLIRKGILEITTVKRASIEGLLQQKILIGFHQTPLGEVLDDLSDLTGASIVVDGRHPDKLETPITAFFRNDVTLGAALTMVTNMSGLEVVQLKSALYVTTPENARSLEPHLKKKGRE